MRHRRHESSGLFLSRKILLNLLLDPLLDEAGGILVASYHRMCQRLRLLERGVWRNRRNVRIAPDVEQGRPVRRQRAVPCTAELVSIAEVFTDEPDTAGERCVVHV